MIRVVITQLVLFALPFVAFFVYRATTHGWASAWKTSTGRALFWLIVAGGILAVAGFVYFAVSGTQETGVYVPAHLEDGRLVPGEFRPR